MTKICARGAVVVALAVGVIASGCAKGAESGTASSPSAPAPGAAAADLRSLVPPPADTVLTKGPDSISDNGIHLFYEVKGSPTAVMESFKKALEDKGWDMTAVTTSGDEGGGGATYTGTKGEAYGVFDGGGPSATTYIDVCTWPLKPADTNCARGGR
jgi:hypothetical protein